MQAGYSAEETAKIKIKVFSHFDTVKVNEIDFYLKITEVES